MYFLSGIIILLGGIFGAIFKSPKRKGIRGEKRVDEVLSKLNSAVSEDLAGLSPEYHILDDVILKTDRGTTQIDHIIVSRYGIFTIETKNYRGDIYGDDKRKEWTQLIVTDVTYARKWYKTYTYVTKNRFYNPVKQSLGHAIEIKKHLSDFPNLWIVPIVVFAGEATLANVESKYDVIYLKDLRRTIMKYNKEVLSDYDVSKIIKTLKSDNVRENIKDREHVKNIKNARKSDALKVSHGVCPRCGGTLVKRTGKYGTFYGCSNYPKCKYTAEIARQ